MTAVCRNAAFVSLTQLALVNLLNSVVCHVSACPNYSLLRILNKMLHVKYFHINEGKKVKAMMLVYCIPGKCIKVAAGQLCSLLASSWFMTTVNVISSPTSDCSRSVMLITKLDTSGCWTLTSHAHTALCNLKRWHSKLSCCMCLKSKEIMII